MIGQSTQGLKYLCLYIWIDIEFDNERTKGSIKFFNKSNIFLPIKKR